MGLLDVNHLRKEFSGEVLFDDVSFTINPGDKLALIGSNGAGKTTILKIILGQELKDGGSFNVAQGKTVGYLSQVMITSFENTMYQEMLTAFADVIKMEKELKDLTIEMSNNPNDQALLKRYGTLESIFSMRGGYDYTYLIDLMIFKFGFSKDDYNRKISTFSGGERNKIAFTKLLLNHPDLLILDEPTNHLDVSTIQWLEDYLKSYDGSILLVSHDRYFIDNVCNCIFELTNKTGEFYRGNYSYYLDEKVTRYEQRLKAYNLQQSEIEHLQELIKKFKPKPTKVAFAKDREKKLSRIMDNKMDKPTVRKSSVHFNLQSNDNRRVRQLSTMELTFGYDNIALCDPIDLVVWGGDKIGIIGDNGTGKTTLLKTIGEMLLPISGKIVKHRLLKIGYIDQNQIQISSTETIFNYFQNLYPQMSNFDVRHHLGSFLFTGEDVFKVINTLSGGEKVRLSFARLVLQKYDILLLDEPTNHLDIETRKVLESTLSEYPGTIIFVSHDRYFIDELATRIVNIKDKHITVFDGDYAHYLAGEISTVVTEEAEVKVEKEEKKVKTVKFSKEKWEARIATLEDEIDSLMLLTEDEEYYMNQRKMDELDEKITDKKIELDKVTKEYFENIE